MTSVHSNSCHACHGIDTVQYVQEASASVCIECGAVDEFSNVRPAVFGEGIEFGVDTFNDLGSTWVNESHRHGHVEGNTSRHFGLYDSISQRRRYAYSKTLSANSFVKGLVSSMGVDMIVAERAIWLLSRAREALNFGWGKKGQVYAVACVCAALRENSKIYSITELSDRAGMDSTKVCKAFINLKRTLNLKIDGCDPLYHVEREARRIEHFIKSLPPPPSTHRRKSKLNACNTKKRKFQEMEQDDVSDSTTPISTSESPQRVADVMSTVTMTLTGNQLSPELHHYLLNLNFGQVISLARQTYLLMESFNLTTNRQPQYVAIALLAISIEGQTGFPLPNFKEFNLMLNDGLKVTSSFSSGERYREMCRVIEDLAEEWEGFETFIKSLNEKKFKKGRGKWKNGGKGLVKRELVKLIKPVIQDWKNLKVKKEEKEGLKIVLEKESFSKKIKDLKGIEVDDILEDFDSRSDFSSDDFLSPSPPSSSFHLSPSITSTTIPEVRSFCLPVKGGRPLKYVRLKGTKKSMDVPNVAKRLCEKFGKKSVEELDEDEIWEEGELERLLLGDEDEEEIERRRVMWDMMKG